MITQQNISELLEGIKQGDQLAESKFVKKYKERIFTIALHYVSDKEDAEEITYDTLTACLSNVKNDKLREPEKIGSYINSVCWRLCMKHLKKKIIIIKGKKIIHESLDDESKKRNIERTITKIYVQDDPLMILEKSEIRRMIRVAVTKVKNKKYKYILELILEGYSPKEIAKKITFGRKQLYTMLPRARIALGKILDEMRKEET